MKIIRLWVNAEGYRDFDFESESIVEELKKRNISIGDGASIGTRASIGYDASIGDRASIGDDVKVIKSLFIKGSSYGVTWFGTEHICIGGKKYTISEWMRVGEEIAKKENFTPKQIEEYRGYVNICKILFEGQM